ncbi:hypothetical protein [Runella sp.]|uniref:hypothetical protein n=1 Tax=Runella sp. TaxID=1960881 RepID=UPI003D151F31
MKKLLIYTFFLLTLLGSCEPRKVTPITDILGRKWKAKVVKEGTQVVFTLGGTTNVKPGYANFRLDLSNPEQVLFKDIDGRTLTGTWSVSTDNQRLILENLVPKPTATIGTVEFFISEAPSAELLKLERTAESRKTGNTVNTYELIPE